MDLAKEALDLIAVDRASAKMLGRLSPAGNPVGEALVGLATVVASGDVAGQEGIAGTDRGDRVERLGPYLEKALLRATSDHRDAAIGSRDRGLAGAEADQLGESLD